MAPIETVAIIGRGALGIMYADAIVQAGGKRPGPHQPQAFRGRGVFGRSYRPGRASQHHGAYEPLALRAG